MEVAAERERLWTAIDEIDTAGDIFKPTTDEEYRRLANAVRRHAQKALAIRMIQTSDPHCIQLRGILMAIEWVTRDNVDGRKAYRALSILVRKRENVMMVDSRTEELVPLRL